VGSFSIVLHELIAQIVVVVATSTHVGGHVPRGSNSLTLWNAAMHADRLDISQPGWDPRVEILCGGFLEAVRIGQQTCVPCIGEITHFGAYQEYQAVDHHNATGIKFGKSSG
jgi:hypothetical protein